MRLYLSLLLFCSLSNIYAMQTMTDLDITILKDCIKRWGVKKAEKVLQDNLDHEQEPLVWTSNDFTIERNFKRPEGLHGQLFDEAQTTLRTQRPILNSVIFDVTPVTACTVIFHNDGTTQYSFGSSFNSIVAIKKIIRETKENQALVTAILKSRKEIAWDKVLANYKDGTTIPVKTTFLKKDLQKVDPLNPLTPEQQLLYESADAFFKNHTSIERPIEKYISMKLSDDVSCDAYPMRDGYSSFTFNATYTKQGIEQLLLEKKEEKEQEENK